MRLNAYALFKTSSLKQTKKSKLAINTLTILRLVLLTRKRKRKNISHSTVMSFFLSLPADNIS